MGAKQPIAVVIKTFIGDNLKTSLFFMLFLLQ